MEDDRIVDLYWARDERAIAESERKYGRLLRSVSYACLGNREDAEECANDTYLEAWDAMPTARPQFLGAFLSKITRRISIDRFRRDHRVKRGGMEALTAELTDCLPDTSEPTPAEAYDAARTRDAINRFLAGLPADRRTLFVNRYFFGISVAALAASSGLTQANVKVILHRLRGDLKKRLEEEGIPL